jgi:type IV secretory pathway TraG/TraD family ATPase VirD4
MFDPKPSINKHDKNLARAGAFDDLKKIRAIKGKMGFYAFLGFLAGLVLFFPMHVLFFGGVPFSAKLAFLEGFFVDFFRGIMTGTSGIEIWFKSYWGWYFSSAAKPIIAPGTEGAIALWKSGVVLGSWLAATITPLMLIGPKTEGLETTPNIFGDTRWASERDIEAMSSRDLVGFDGKLFLVGKLKNKLIHMKETLSVLLLAPPGTGKTVAFIVPSTVMMDKSCQLLNDQKPELFHMTSGHRAGLGPVFQLMWSAQDMPDGGWVTPEQAELLSPDLIEYDEAGETKRDEMGNIAVGPVYYPSWNPIGPSSIPTPGPKRDLYIERLAAVLCPDPQGGGDKFWTSKARAAMIGLVHYIVAKSEIGQDHNFPEIDESGIPLRWRGKEASYPMMVDWFTDAQNSIDDDGEDPMRQLFKNAIDDAKVMNDAYQAKYGIENMNRAIAELTDLMNAPDKTRGSILATLNEALNPFKNEAVRQRTSSSSFSFNELRGAPRPEARAREEKKRKAARERGDVYNPRYARDEWDPITIYISINAEDAKAFATITGIFVDSANAYLVANGPNAIDDRGNQLGPNDFFFLLDETPTLPKLETVINGPAVGRSKRVSYAIVGQDFAQIETRYSKPEVETMKSTTAVKVILSQNNETAARSISTMAGSMTYKKASYSKKEHGDPITKFLDLKKEIITGENWEKRDFIDASFVMSMPVGKHIVLVQNFMNRPILSDTPRFFEEPEIAKRVYNLRTGSGPKPSLPMPRSYMNVAAQNGEKEATQKKKTQDIKVALTNPEIAIVVTPQNLAALSVDFDTDQLRLEPGSDFAVARVELTDEIRFFENPEESDLKIVSDPDELQDLISDRKVYVFDKSDADTINAKIAQSGHEPIAAELFKEMRSAALEMEGEQEGDFFSIGYYGTARNDRPDDLSILTPSFACHWLCEIVNVVHGCEFEFRRMNVS